MCHNFRRQIKAESEWKKEAERDRLKYNVLGILIMMIIMGLYCNAQGYL